MAQPIEIELKVAQVFKDNELHYEYDVRSNGEVNVKVYGGDWKHGHLYLDHVMTLNGFIPLAEIPFDTPTLEDSYSALHVYKLNESN